MMVAFLFALGVGLGFAQTAQAATRTWTGLGLTTNWSDSANWLGNVVPGSADVAMFDLISSKNAAIGSPISVAGISMSANYTGTITQSPGIAVTIGASGFTQAGGTFAGGTAPITVNGPFALLAGSFISTSGKLSVSGDFTATGGSFDPWIGTTSFGGGAAALTVTTGDVFNNLTFAGGTKTLAAGTSLTAGGALSLTAGSLNGSGSLAAQDSISQAPTFAGGSASLLLNGSGPQTLSGAATLSAGNLPPLVINKPSGTLSLAGTLRTANNWTYTAGTLDPGSSTLIFAGGTISAPGMSFYDVTTNGGTTTLGDAMTVAHDLTVSAGTLTTSASNHSLMVGGSLTIMGTFRGNGSAVAVQADFTTNGTFVPGTSTVTLDGSAGQMAGGTAAATPVFNLVVDDPLGVALAANMTITGRLTLTTGQLNVGAHLLTIRNAIAGTPTNLVADASSSLTVGGAGAGISVPSSVLQLGDLTLDNPSGLAI